ncbi:MAG: Multifunctional non-homologous end joining protein LigD [Phycisphaerae bacterium]|nr:Multifunctional non-homologous end joining protein LigD [Phycisphaerae bacterium]
MLAQMGEPFDSPEFLFEVKWDGTRCIALIDADRIRLQNRRYIEMRERYPEFACLGQLPPGTVLDGEIVVLEAGKPSFPKLQQREHLVDPNRIAIVARRLPATLIAFDLLYDAGECLLRLPLEQRKARLAAVIRRLANPHVIASDYVVAAGVRYFQAAERHGLEGIMAKRLSSPYVLGARSPHWLKIKVAQTGEYEIIGYTPHEKDRDAIGALIIGERHGARWSYKGKVGSGFTDQERREFMKLLRAAAVLERAPRDGPKDGVWRLGGLRCVVRYFEKTKIGMLRAPVYKGIVRTG